MQILVLNHLPKTVTSKEHVSKLPAESSAVYSIVREPTGNALPDGSPIVWVGVIDSPELSVTVGAVHETVAVVIPGPASTVISEGQSDSVGASAAELRK